MNCPPFTSDPCHLLREEVEVHVNLELEEFGPSRVRMHLGHVAGLLSRQLCCQLRNEVFIRTECTPVVVASVPRGWWDGFKVRFFPRWLLKRLPAEYREITASAAEIYTQLPIAIPGAERHIVLHTAP